MKRLLAIALILGTLMLSGPEAEARKWKPTNLDLARDYLVIEHSKSPQEMVFVVWVAPAMVESGVEAKTARAVLSEYILIMVGHAAVSDLLQWQFVQPSDVVIETAGGDIRRGLSDDDVPLLVSTMKNVMSETLAQGMGPMGENAVSFVFDGKGIADCEEGVFWIRYAGESYEYRTPVPGCRKEPAPETGRVGDKASLN